MWGVPSHWTDAVRNMLRTAYLTWEFWIPPALAVLVFSSLVWLMMHNQDLIRKAQFAEQTKVQVQHVTNQIQSLTGEVHELRTQVQKNAKEVREVKAEVQK